MPIELKQINSNVNITKPTLKAGGYYVPAVSEDGDLSWTPSESNMPSVEAVNISGPIGEKGERGDSGVYVGTSEPTDENVLIWLNPDGDATEGLATKEYVDEAIANIDMPDVDLTGYATEKYVDDAIAAIEIPEVDLSDYALKTDIPSLEGYAKTEDIPDVSGFQTEAQVIALIEEYGGVVELPASEEGEF